MKNINRYINKFSLAIVLTGLILGGCEGYLDQEPQAQVTEAIYFETPEQFENAANYFYTRLDWEAGDEGSDLSGNLTSEAYASGNTTVPTADAEYWDDNYTQMRAPNQLLEKAAEYEGDASEIATSVGTAYFFRAWHHWKLLKRYGGVPIVLKSLDVSDEELYAPRNSRYEVIFQIMSDLDMAIAKLPDANSMDLQGGDQGKLSAEAAKAFKARVCLYAGSWDKYVGTSTDGDGTSVGAGSAKPSGYPSVDGLLNEAKTLAKQVMDNGAFELWDKKDEIEAALPGYGEQHLFYLFCLEDGTSNPAGLTKADNKEFIFSTVYDYVLRQNRNNLTHAHGHCPTRKLMDMYLCTDGLPVQHSAVFEGYDLMESEFNNRDLRLVGLTRRPIKEYWGYGSGTSGGGHQYDKEFSDIAWDFRYVPNLNNEAATRNMGYYGDKFTHRNYYRETREQAFNYPQIRLAEVMLIYAEATCELNGGSIDDADLNISINPIRARSGVAPLTNDLIAPFGDLNMLGEIRRERAIELFGENQRYDDLKRWGIAEDELNRNVCTAYAEGTEFETAEDPKNPGTMIYDPTAWSYGTTQAEEAPSTYAGIATTKPGAVIIDSKANRRFERRNYVDPIPSIQIDINPALLQNPEW